MAELIHNSPIGRNACQCVPAKSTYRVELTAEQSPIDPAIRLRQALKLLLRAFGLRCISITDITDEPKDRAAAQE